MDEATLRLVKTESEPRDETSQADATISLGSQPAPGSAPGSLQTGMDADFLTRLARGGALSRQLQHERSRCLAEIEALRAENRWEDILALFHPVEEKAPELDAVGLAEGLRSEVAFALGHLNRFDEAIRLYQTCVDVDSGNFHFHAGLAYTAYNSLYAAKTRQVMLHPAERKVRQELAHRHFSKANELRPDAVTNYYRQGMLYKQIQGQHENAVPFFETAVRNWQAYGEEQKQLRRQERKNYVKSLYHLASCLLEMRRARKALEHLTVCLKEDEISSYLSTVHKYFALGKIHYQLGDYESARQALEAAAANGDPAEDEYVFELLARIHLAMNDPLRASQALGRIPPSRRRPYVRWTEADVLTLQGETDRACRVLREAAEKDRRGAHKALIRLSRLEFGRQAYEQSLKAAQRARAFFESQYQNPLFEGLFWEAAALLRLGRRLEALESVLELERLQPNYPNLGKLKQVLEGTLPEPTDK